MPTFFEINIENLSLDQKEQLQAWRIAHKDTLLFAFFPYSAPGKLIVKTIDETASAIPDGIEWKKIGEIEPVWGLTAVLKDLYYDNKGVQVHGSRYFNVGDTVYPLAKFSGDAYERAYITGKSKIDGRIISVITPTKRYENWKVELIDNPIVLIEYQHRPGGWNGEFPRDKVFAEVLAKMMNERNKV